MKHREYPYGIPPIRPLSNYELHNQHREPASLQPSEMSSDMVQRLLEKPSANEDIMDFFRNLSVQSNPFGLPSVTHGTQPSFKNRVSVLEKTPDFLCI